MRRIDLHIHFDSSKTHPLLPYFLGAVAFLEAVVIFAHGLF